MTEMKLEDMFLAVAEDDSAKSLEQLLEKLKTINDLSADDLPENFDLNDEFKAAFDLMENTRGNLFVTGKAGTGKSTLLNYFKANTSKNIVVLAPTGVAAIRIGGQT
ncbi:MAG: AAA family ATPase, partial [Victivallaceae bacterium]